MAQKYDKSKAPLCIYINTLKGEFEFYSIENEDRSSVNRDNIPYSSKQFTAEFMNELSAAVKDYLASHSSASESAVTLLVPDSVVAMDTITIPNMNRRRNEEAVDATLTGLYKNRDDLIINSCVGTQNKNLVTYSLSIMNKQLSTALNTAVQDGGLSVVCTTFVSNAITNAVSELVPKIKNSSYLLLDIKHHTSSFSFVAKGRTTGSFSLPFGYSILRKSKVYSEDMLFDHSVAELAVLNAREKAKAKQLTMMQVEEPAEGEENAEENLDAMFGGDENATDDPTTATQTIKTLPKKQPRKLPKFMQRPLPKNDEETAYENFRIFMKWALNLLSSNDKLKSQGEPEAIYVNMPVDLNFLIDMANEEKEENEIEFRPLEIKGDRDEIMDVLELYGALYSVQYNKTNNF